jgi:hypothetical protein
MKYLSKIGTLFTLLFIICLSISKEIEANSSLNEHTGASWYVHRTLSAMSKTIRENPIFSIIGAYYLLFDNEAIKQNTFWSGVFGACLLASFVKNLVSPHSYPKNFIAKTIIENPFFSFIAGHMLLLHADKIKQYPLETMIVGGVLAFDLAENYEEEHEDKREVQVI